ncbi:MAG: hydantoinase/oxoprolinase N-terminal domain-containing protein, partial [Acetobacteraceae bacterium]
MTSSSSDLDIGVDIGGTFTDVVYRRGTEPAQGLKIPTSRGDPSQAVMAALQHLCATLSLDPGDIARFLHGTTIATNAVLERKGAKIGLLASAGFGDVLEIGFQLRTELYKV